MAGPGTQGSYAYDEMQGTPLGPEQHFEKTPNTRVRQGHEDVEGSRFKTWEGGDSGQYMNNRGDILNSRFT